MGFTHYWTQTRSFSLDEWAEVKTDMAAILSYVQHGADTPLADGQGTAGTHPVVTDTRMLFNGVGDNAHETFALSRTRGRTWSGSSLGADFCKTARKPYDLAVTACLCYLSSVTATHTVSSDGSGADFVAGLAAAREALPHKANLLDIPMGVMQSDRWTGPWIRDGGGNGTGFHVGFCVDGKGYVTHLKSGVCYRFDNHAALGRYLDDNKVAKFRNGGSSVFGRYSNVESDIWFASGSFDELRHRRIARAQAKVLRALFPVPAEHAAKPPAYVRPGEWVRPEDNGTFCYSLSELLQTVA